MKYFLMLLCMVFSIGYSSYVQALDRVSGVLIDPVKESDFLLNEFVSSRTKLKITIENIKNKKGIGYKSVSLNLNYKASEWIELDRLNSNRKPNLQLDGEGNIRVYHNRKLYDDTPVNGVLLYIKFKNKVVSFPILNFHEKSFFIKNSKLLYIENVSVDIEDIYNGEYWLEVGLVNKEHVYGSKDSL